MNASAMCDALGNEVRFSIIRAMKNHAIATCCSRIEFHENGVSVGDVVNTTGLAQSTVSQHLKVLLESGLIYKEKRGQWTVYFLNTSVISGFLSELSAELLQSDCTTK